MKLPVIDTIYSKGNKFVKGVRIKVTVNSKLNDGSVYSIQSDILQVDREIY